MMADDYKRAHRVDATAAGLNDLVRCHFCQAVGTPSTSDGRHWLCVSSPAKADGNVAGGSRAEAATAAADEWSTLGRRGGRFGATTIANG